MFSGLVPKYIAIISTKFVEMENTVNRKHSSSDNENLTLWYFMIHLLYDSLLCIEFQGHIIWFGLTLAHSCACLQSGHILLSLW